MFIINCHFCHFIWYWSASVNPFANWVDKTDQAWWLCCRPARLWHVHCFCFENVIRIVYATLDICWTAYHTSLDHRRRHGAFCQCSDDLWWLHSPSLTKCTFGLLSPWFFPPRQNTASRPSFLHFSCIYRQSFARSPYARGVHASLEANMILY